MGRRTKREKREKTEFNFDFVQSVSMGSSASRIGARKGPRGTTFIGDIRSEARYGLPLESHPVQDVIAKAEPLNYIGNVLYPKVGARFLFFPRQYALTPVNNGFHFGHWRKADNNALFFLVASFIIFGHFMAAKANYGSDFNVSWRGGDSVLYGKAGSAHANEILINEKLGGMYK